MLVDEYTEASDMAKRRKVGNPLALTVLASLIERPMHPYELASIAKHRGKDRDMKINWGSLYTVVANLEKHGFIAATGTDRQGRRPERTVYEITPAGRAELTDWVRELLGNPEREFPAFRAALSVAGILGPDEVTAQLTARLHALDEQLAEEAAELAETARTVPRIFLIEGEYALAMRRTEADWVRGLLAEITGGTLPGLAAWRRYFETGALDPEVAKLAEEGRPTD
jgi:DNA-binding PadR family transcriptional regulator